MAFSSSSSLSASPNVTPLIDVLLVLLIIFMVIVPLSPRGLESLVPVPSSAAQREPEPPALVIRVEPASIAGASVSYAIEGRSLDPADLRRVLRQTRAGSARSSVLISGDPRLDYGSVVLAVSEAQQAGFRTIGLLPRHMQ